MAWLARVGRRRAALELHARGLDVAGANHALTTVDILGASTQPEHRSDEPPVTWLDAVLLGNYWAGRA